MSTNANILFDATYSVLDTTVSPNAYTVNRLRDLLLPGVSAYYNPFYQAGQSVVAIPSPVTAIQMALIINLSTTTDLSVFITPAGGSIQSAIILQPALFAGQPGGCFLYMNPSIAPLVGVNAGLAAVSLQAAVTGTPCEILLAG